MRGAGGVGLSRLVGLGREVALAHAFGASATYDAFLIAFLIPHLLRRLLGEGGMAAAFLPVYTQARLAGHGPATARTALVGLTLLLVPLCILGSWLAPSYVPILARGFSQEKMALAVRMAGWLFPLLAMFALAALAGALHNAHGRFFLPAVAPATLSLGIIAGALLLARLTSPPGLGLAVGTLTGGGAMVLLLAPSGLKWLRGGRGWRWGELALMGRRLLPVLGGLAVAELNLLVDYRLASHLPDGSVSVLQYGLRLFQFPLGVLAVSVATAALPRLARESGRGDPIGFRRALAQGLGLGGVLLMPALAGLLLLGKAVVGLLYQHGAFTAQATQQTAAALSGYLVGLLAYGMVYLFSRACYALGRPGVPLAATVLTVVVNVGLDLWWVRWWGTTGLALATGVAGWAGTTALGVWLWRKLPGWWPGRIVGKAALATGGMALGLWSVLRAGLASWGWGWQVLLGVPAGLFLYSFLAWVLRIKRDLRVGLTPGEN